MYKAYFFYNQDRCSIFLLLMYNRIDIFLERNTIVANLVYDRFKNRVTDKRQKNLHIFGSSSSGNSIYFKDARILIDLGFPYKTYVTYDPTFFLDVDYVMLTHEHVDHLKPATLFRLLKLYPSIKIIVPPNMWQDMLAPNFAKRINQQELVKYASHFYYSSPMLLTNRRGMKIKYIPHITAHGPITNCAIELIYNNQHVMYASDLDEFNANPERRTQGLPMDSSNPFDILCLEANYDPDILYNYIKNHPDDYRASENFRHTDEKTAWNYVEKYLKSNGIFVPLHASHTFGTLWQDLDGSFN